MNMNTKTQTLPKFAKARNIWLWTLQILTAAVFLTAGFIKLSGDSMTVESFADIGLGQWFRNLTGAIEIVSALMLVVPRFVAVGALLLVGTMFGATAAHLFVIGGSPLAPLVLLLFNVVIFWSRYDDLVGYYGDRFGQPQQN